MGKKAKTTVSLLEQERFHVNNIQDQQSRDWLYFRAEPFIEKNVNSFLETKSLNSDEIFDELKLCLTESLFEMLEKFDCARTNKYPVSTSMHYAVQNLNISYGKATRAHDTNGYEVTSVAKAGVGRYADMRSENPAEVDDIERASKEAVPKMLSTLTPREQKVIELRFWKGYTQREVAKEFLFSEANASQIEAKALRKLRHPYRTKHAKDILR